MRFQLNYNDSYSLTYNWMRISVRIQGELGADHPWIQFHPKPCFTFSVKPWPPLRKYSHLTVLSNYNNPSKPLHKQRFTLPTANMLPYNILNPNNKMYVKIEGKYLFLFLFLFKTSSFCAHQTRAIWCESQKNFVCKTRHAKTVRVFTGRLDQKSSTQHPLKETVHNKLI